MSGNGKRTLKPMVARESLADKMAKFHRRQGSTGVNWAKVDPATLKGSILAATSSGAALMFSQASGGRGICITIFDDGDREKFYAIDHEELMEHLGAVIEVFQGSSEDVRQAVS